MREILFRAKAVNRKEGHEYRTDYKNGDWVYGLLANNNPYADFAEMTNTDGISSIEVDKNTIGQYTGLTDKNGKKIFEGDIVHAVYSHDYVGIPDTDFGNLIVWFDGTYYGGARYQMDIIGGVGNRVFSVGLRNGVEIIGNIHDNPELIGGC